MAGEELERALLRAQRKILALSGAEPQAELIVLRKRMRGLIERHLMAAERLIAALDALDDDRELEDEGSLEPSLGATVDGRYREMTYGPDIEDDSEPVSEHLDRRMADPFVAS
jgi:hypothetical protein